MSAAAVHAQGLGKLYRLFRSPRDRFLPDLPGFRRRPPIDIWSLQGVDLEVPRGACLGVIGRNGAGKSTLLKILTGVIQPTRGSLGIEGTTLALLELGAGFNPELTGAENVMVSASLIGLRPEDMRTRIDAIRDFADIGDHFDKPVKHYSSGMFVRLAFSLYVNMDPDVLIIDEALSVGDFFFQQKCASKLREIKERGTTILFVSHDTAAVQELCDEAILLENGVVAARGDPSLVTSTYFISAGEGAAGGGVAATAAEDRSGPDAVRDQLGAHIDAIRANDLIQSVPATGSGGLSLLGLRVLNRSGCDCLSFHTGDTMIIEAAIRANRAMRYPNFGLLMADAGDRAIWSAANTNKEVSLGSVIEGEIVIVRVEIDLEVAPGRYSFNAAAGEADVDDPSHHGWHDARLRAFAIEVKASLDRAHRRGIVYTPISLKAL